MMQIMPACAIFDNYWATTLAFARSLGRRDVPLHFYGHGAGRWSRYCRRRLRCPPIELCSEFQPWLRDKVRSGEIARVAPTTDLIAYHVSSLRHEFAPEVQRTIAPLAEIENCLIKTRFSASSSLAGCPTLPTFAPDSLEGAFAVAANLGYPLMLKPKSHLMVGFVERGQLITSDAELARHYQRYPIAPGQEGVAAAYPELLWPLLQRYVPSARDRVYSVTGIKDVDGRVLTSCLSYKCEQWPPDIGVSMLQISHHDQRILDFGLKIVNQTLSRGIFEVELLADGDALYAIDLNPRAFGFIELDIARGCDLPWLWFRSSMESPLPSVPAPTEVPLQARHWLLHSLQKMARSHKGQNRDITSPRASVSMLGHRSDPLPMLISNLHLLRHPRSLLRARFGSSRAVPYQKL